MRELLVVVVCAIISGCAVLTDTAADAADAHLNASIYSICNAQSVGAWVRKFGTDKTKADAWRTLCGTTITETPAK